jgi:diacylglycerol kinase family enzyme
MNMARTLCIPRDLDSAARIIAQGQGLAMDVGRIGDRYFLEAAGVGLDAGLFAYFDRLDRGAARLGGVLRGAIRFLQTLGRPRVIILADGSRQVMRASMIAVANGPFVGAAYTIAPDARIDDGMLDLVVFRGAGLLRLLLHLALVAGGRSMPFPAATRTLRAARVEIDLMRRRPFPVHADGKVVGTTPVRFEAVPAALKVLVGTPSPDATCAWVTEES